jgi:hypothetical protein
LPRVICDGLHHHLHLSRAAFLPSCTTTARRIDPAAADGEGSHAAPSRLRTVYENTRRPRHCNLAAPRSRFRTSAHVPTSALLLLFARLTLAQCLLSALIAPPPSRHLRDQRPCRFRGLDRLSRLGTERVGICNSSMFATTPREAHQRGSLKMTGPLLS